MVLRTPPPTPSRAGSLIAARDLLDATRIDLLSQIPNLEMLWDWLLAKEICDEYGLTEEDAILDRWLNVLPSVRGRMADRYMEAVRQGQKEVRERVSARGRERSGSSGPPPED